MCQAVFCDGQRYDTVGGLRGLLGCTLAQDRMYEIVDDLPDGDCLCPVDIATTAFAAGYRAKQLDDGDWQFQEILPV